MIDQPQITPTQAKAARMLLRWGNMRVCKGLSITLDTLRRAELAGDKVNPVSPAIFARLRRLYEAAGVEFVNGERPGVWMKATSSLPIFLEDHNSLKDE